MKALDPMVFIAVFQEMLGVWLWILFAAILLSTVAFVTLLLREKGFVTKRLVRSQAGEVLGGIAALVIIAKVSSSGFTHAAGPVDWILIALVFVAGLIGATILLYTVAGWLPGNASCRTTA